MEEYRFFFNTEKMKSQYTQRNTEDCCAMKEKFLPQRKYKRKYTQRVRRELLRNDGNGEKAGTEKIKREVTW